MLWGKRLPLFNSMKIVLKIFKIGEGMGMRSGLCGSGSCGAVGLVWCWGDGRQADCSFP